jgi:hypothetical protein
MNSSVQRGRSLIQNFQGARRFVGFFGAFALLSCSSGEPPSKPVAKSSQALSSIAFQQGALPTASYAGSTDTTLRQTAPSGNFGNDATCLIDGDDGAGADLSCLLRWDLSQIPAGSTVQSASVTLTIVNPTGNTYNLFAVKRTWNELEAT